MGERVAGMFTSMMCLSCLKLRLPAGCIFLELLFATGFRLPEPQLKKISETTFGEKNRMNMNYRDWLQQVIYKIINPVVRGMIKIGITPNFITTTGLILNIVAAGILFMQG